ncbi:F-box/WD repeat-containing protein lin-23 [Vanrija pseudolonga]|uniref:F-box/WD repeat-containing protein lin-23 n=1 Tax=Vanrija pseudolonga TaxID=143232 RepID=A0AAF0Y9I2_9TREE|nr:F-box/WD repeat-containing protein lin-23 [Vanrija pseudolonga]
MSAHDIHKAVLALPLATRREVATALLWSLPRDEIMHLHQRLARMMQKDIVGLLPPELSIRILSMLDADDLLQCKLVNRTWALLCDDQTIWLKLCRSHSPPIAPAHTTWQDLTFHRQLLQAGNAPTEDSRTFGDESFEYTSDDDVGVPSPRTGHLVPSGTSTPGPRGLPHGLRQLVWERPQGGLPTYQRASATASPSAFPPSDSPHDPPIASHLHLPTVLPKVNYKHLYLARRILSRRMTDSRPSDVETSGGSRRTGSWNPRVTILTSVSSSTAGGLPGHSESIYSLQLFRYHMKLTMVTGDQDDFMYTLQTALNTVFPSPSYGQTDVFGTPVSSSWPGIGNPGVPRPPSTTMISGRDWLLSGSRDHTLRLWQMDCETPRVVKIFSGGHTGSILTHFVIELEDLEPAEVKSAGSSPTKTSGGRFSKSPSKSPGPSGTPRRRKRLMALSGGSDGRICLWDLEHGNGTPEKVIEAHTDSVLFLRGDNERLISCSKDRTIRVFDIRTLERKLVITGSMNDDGHRGAVNAVGLTKDLIISASGDRSIKVWDINDGRLLATIDAHVRGISCIGFEPYASPLSGWKQEVPGSVLRGTIVTGSSDWSIKTFHVVQLPPSAEDNETLTFRDMLGFDERLQSEVLTGTRPRIVIQPGVVYHATCSCPMPMTRTSPAGCSRCLNRGHTELVRSLHLGEQVTLSASYDSTIKMWDRQTGRLIFDFEGCHSGRVFAITGNRMRVASSGLDARIAIVDFSEGIDTAFI